ncbi:YciI family protein [Streptomyces naganishii]|uniref:Uncharacterized protein n=1 Tax=Streptomyces naganishii JCM 4654 TaxID=1306179 RepID=A0A919CUG1_9ACTN|nr:hypothetical protein [Streptomyces naganishii]GHD86805.1 hypothetical protein GCM10010508_16070 [Streptomyces naganishii JCM 4654]
MHCLVIAYDHPVVIGSMLVVAADSREDLDAWLRVEPYVVDGVRREVGVHPCRVGPSFLHLVAGWWTRWRWMSAMRRLRSSRGPGRHRCQ